MLKRVVTRVGMGIGALMFLVAAECKDGNGPMAPGNDINGPEHVTVEVLWLSGKRPLKLDLEVGYTAPGKPTVHYNKKCCGNDFSIKYAVVMEAGQRVSITVDQRENDRLQCSIYGGPAGKTVYAYEHRNDAGSVHCEWVKHKKQHAMEG